jgi:hypothetical protein
MELGPAFSRVSHSERLGCDAPHVHGNDTRRELRGKTSIGREDDAGDGYAMMVFEIIERAKELKSICRRHSLI